MKNIDDIKDAFVKAWLDGHPVTVKAMVQAHPEHQTELIEFGMCFAELHAIPLVESAPTDLALKALDKALNR